MGRPQFDLPQSIIARLGREPDKMLAAAAGCSGPTIARARAERNILPYPYAKFEAKPEPVATPESSPVRAAFQNARVSAEGMVIPFDLFVQAAKEVL